VTAAGTDAARNARLVLDAELQSGRLTHQEVDAASRLWQGARGPSFRPTRLAQRFAMKRGLKDGIRLMLDPTLALRRDALGADANGQPKFLVRVDEFPYSSAFDQPDRYGVDATRTFHEIMTGAGVPYLMGVVSQLTSLCLDPDADGGRELNDEELEFLARIQVDGVVLGQHGATHRTRFRSPRRYSELGGLGDDVIPLLDAAREKLGRMGVETRVLVPPFNRFDADQWQILTERYSVITGGPESVLHVGARPSPTWWGDAVYVPCYRPLYADARTIVDAVDQVVDLQPGCWVPIVLHTAWEVDDNFEGLRQLVERLAPYAAPWPAFFDAVDRSAEPAA
jgi:Uncharacterized protein conserved in bacteria (DUF2334)